MADFLATHMNATDKEGNYDFQKLGKAMARKANALFKIDRLEESI